MLPNKVDRSRTLRFILNGASGVGEEQPEKAPRLLNAQTPLCDEDCELAILANQKVKKSEDWPWPVHEVFPAYRRLGKNWRLAAKLRAATAPPRWPRAGEPVEGLTSRGGGEAFAARGLTAGAASVWNFFELISY